MKTKGEQRCFVGNREKIEVSCDHVWETHTERPYCFSFRRMIFLRTERKDGKTIIYPCAECQGRFFAEV